MEKRTYIFGDWRLWNQSAYVWHVRGKKDNSRNFMGDVSCWYAENSITGEKKGGYKSGDNYQNGYALFPTKKSLVEDILDEQQDRENVEKLVASGLSKSEAEKKAIRLSIQRAIN